MQFNLQKPERKIEVTDLEELFGIILVMNERDIDSRKILTRYYVNAPSMEIKGVGVLTSVSGNGETMDEALCDYARLLSNKVAVIGAYSENRKEFSLPTVVHTKLLEEPEKKKTKGFLEFKNIIGTFE